MNATFEQLVGEAERLGANRGHSAVIDLYRSWIAVQGYGGRHFYAAWFNLGVELSRAGDLRGATLAYQTSLALRSDFSLAAINLGLVLEQTGDAAGALRTWTQAIQPDEARVALINHQARLLEKAGQLEQAEDRLRTSLLITPQQPDVIQHWLHIRQKMCLWPILTDTMPGLSPEFLLAYCGPLAALALSDRVTVQTEICASWIERKTSLTPERLSPERGYRHDRIRIGYVSSDFCRHALSYLIAELFERHDRRRFEIYGYCATTEDGSDIRHRVVSAFDHYRSIRELSDEDAARLIRQDEIDVLIDLNGLTQGSRLQVLRWRPAPVQATYLGFVGPVPLPELDYFFCDDIVVPPDTASLYQPRPLYIAGNYQANDSKREIGITTTRSQVGLPEECFVFCCFSNHYKITQEMFTCWMAILQQVDGSVLWLSDDNEWSRRNLRQQATACGIDPARILFAKRIAPSQYMSRLSVADLFLDTFPYNAGTIASDAIRMGLPLLTLSGEAFASRMAARLLTAVGAEAGIAEVMENYVQKAILLAKDREYYANYRKLFSEARWTNTIGDIGRLTTELEGTLERIVKQS